jgi:hypothetical protein
MRTVPWFGVDAVYVVAYPNLGFDRVTFPFQNRWVQNEPLTRPIVPTFGPDGARSIGKWTGLPTSGPAGARVPPVRSVWKADQQIRELLPFIWSGLGAGPDETHVQTYRAERPCEP